MGKIVLLVGENSGFVYAVFFFLTLSMEYIFSFSMFGAEFGFADVPVSLSFKEKKNLHYFLPRINLSAQEKAPFIRYKI